MTSAARQAAFARGIPYEAGLALLLGLTMGVVLFDRNAIGFLSPYLAGGLKLSVGQIGLAASAVSLTWALGGLVIGRLADRTGRRKALLLAAVIIFSLCSIGTGFASGFLMLLGTRLFMGLAEGPVPSLGMALVIDASTPERRGLNVGLFAACAGCVGGVLAPVILVRWAEALGWRTAFVLAGLPGLVLALALAITVRETQRPVQQSAGSIAALRRLMAIPNIWASAIVASLCMTCLVVTQALLPLFLVRARGLTPVNMSLIMGAVGVGALVGGFLLPAASDRVGRKPVLIVAALLGGLPALVCFGAPGQVTSLFAVFGLFGAAGALLHIVISMIPGESADPADRVTAFGLVMGVAEILGGFVAPALTGFASDRVGLIAVPLVAGGSAVAAGVMSLLLVETAPRVAARRQTSLEPA